MSRNRIRISLISRPRAKPVVGRLEERLNFAEINYNLASQERIVAYKKTIAAATTHDDWASNPPRILESKRSEKSLECE